MVVCVLTDMADEWFEIDALLCLQIYIQRRQKVILTGNLKAFYSHAWYSVIVL